MMFDQKKYRIFSITILIIYSLPFLLSPYNFLDDLFRSSNGSLITWYYNARPLSITFFRFISGSFFPSDPYPFSFIFSFIVLYFIFIFIVDKIVVEENYELKLSVFILLLCNPFFLQNLSYKYDCIMMVMSTLCAVLFVFIKEYKNIIIDYIIRSLIIFTLFCFYQSALSMVCGLLAIKMLVDVDKKSFLNLILDVVFKILVVLIVFYIYKICISEIFLVDGFVNAGKTITIDYTLFDQLFKNIAAYSSVLSFFIYKKYVLISVIALIFMCVCTSVENVLRQNYKKLIIFIFCLPLLIIALTSSNIVLAHPLVHMREMMGVSSVFVFLLVYINKNKYFIRISFFLACILLLTTFLISSAIYNLKRLEYQRQELVIQDIIRSIQHFGINKVEGISFISDDLQSPSQKTIIKNYPLLNSFFDEHNFSEPWYANGVINGQFYLHKIVMGTHPLDFPQNVEIFSSCYTRSALKEVILYIKVGAFCNTFINKYNSDFP